MRMSHTVAGTPTNYTWDVNASLPVVLQDGLNTYVYGLDLISATDSLGVQTYFTYDGLGSTADLTNGSGTVTGTYSYDVFGAVRAQTGGGENVWQFTGEQRDADSGTYFLRARYYDPATGRFLGRDPLNIGNRYSYVGNNPTNRIDPYGLFPGVPDVTPDFVDDAIDEIGDTFDDYVVDPVHSTYEGLASLDITTILQVLDVLPIAELCFGGAFAGVFILGGLNPASAAGGGVAGTAAYVACDTYIENPIAAAAAIATQNQINRSGCGLANSASATGLNILNWTVDLGPGPGTEIGEIALYLAANESIDCPQSKE